MLMAYPLFYTLQGVTMMPQSTMAVYYIAIDAQFKVILTSRVLKTFNFFYCSYIGKVFLRSLVKI